MKLEISLARFKKKRKYRPEPDPKDAENKDIPTEFTDKPPTESEENLTGKWTAEPEGKDQTPEKPPEKPPTDEDDPIDKSATKKLTDRLFWMRIAFSIIGGVIATYVFEDITDVEEKRWTSIGFMIMLFIATAIIAKSWKIKIANKKKYVITGIGSFVFLYLFFWIMSYTLIHAGDTGGIVPFT